ncbi:MAG TPA: restriction endonuclease subunit S [Desulfovibrio sp.]|uniref:restriction endonuclease subunit S n=1 Tax=Desulfovibrio sp. TaxID=885 RepID=UPI002D33B436|nr:restriction endonuclease subunit S [Desulfovibrio sp.]HZF62441.1 restriction endonuclease subunit S [Desulfovibrio sp.]
MRSNRTQVRLNDVADVISGYAFPSKEFKESGTPVVKISNIRVGHMDMTESQRVSDEFVERLHPKYVVKANDILISLTGSHISQPNSVVGRVARYSSKLCTALLNQRAGKIIVTDFERCDPNYLYWILVQKSVREQIASMAHGAANQANVSPSQVGSLQIFLPKIATQRRIASILSAYDDLIENNMRRIAILEEMARRIYEEWFVRFRFPGHEQVKMMESELGMIPEGWQVQTVADFGKVITGKTPSKSDPENFGDDVPFIKTPDMHGNLFCISTGEGLSAKGAESQKGKTLPENSLCVSCIGTAGVVSITTRPAQTNQQINAVVLNEQHNREFLYFALVGLKETINLYGANGATMVNLNKSKFEGLKIVYGDSPTVDHYHTLAFSFFEEIRVLQLKNANLRATRDLLLPKLISGELDVSSLPEPEEVITA